MKWGALAVLMVLSFSVAQAAQKRFTIEDVADPVRAEQNSFAINETLDDFWRQMKDADPDVPPLGRRFTIDLADPSKTEYNAFALMEMVDDLWTYKLDLAPAGLERQQSIENLNDPAESDENTFAINQMLDDLARAKEDK